MQLCHSATMQMNAIWWPKLELVLVFSWRDNSSLRGNTRPDVSVAVAVFRCASISYTDLRDLFTDWLTDWFIELDMNHSYFLQLWNVVVPNCKIFRIKLWKYLSQIVECICLELQNVFVFQWQMYLFKMAKCICFQVSKICQSCLFCFCFCSEGSTLLNHSVLSVEGLLSSLLRLH